MNVSQVAAPPVGSAASQSAEAARRSRRWTASALAVLGLTLVGAAIRLVVAHQSLFADELATYWLITTRGLGGVISTLYSTHAEITPPLDFIASWFTTQLGHAPELVRLPSLVAGVLTIPVIYLLGLRTVGRAAALTAAALTTLSQFMIYYSAEARGYSLMMLLTTLSTLSMLIAVDTRRARWWVCYAVSSCAAFYTHYICGFVLATQFLWLVWVHPEARRPAVLANLGAVAALLPWTGGLINDYTSPTTKILSALSPFTVHDVRLSLEHWAVGYPYTWVARLPKLPGVPALVLLGLATIAATIGTAATLGRPALSAEDRPPGRPARSAEARGRGAWVMRLDRRIVLIVGLAACVPVGEAIVSAFSTHILGVRNLAASWPALALAFAALLAAPGPRMRLATTGLAIVAFALGAANMLSDSYQRPNLQAAANFIDRHAGPGDAVIDISGVLSPGPLTALDVALHRHLLVFRAGSPAERDHPFGFFDPIASLSEAAREAVIAAPRGRIFVVTNRFPRSVEGITERQKQVRQQNPFPAGYHVIEFHRYVGMASTDVAVYAPARRS